MRGTIFGRYAGECVARLFLGPQVIVDCQEILRKNIFVFFVLRRFVKVP